MIRNKILIAITAAIIPFASALSTEAPDYPSKPIKIVVPFPPGGSTDTLIRMMAPYLNKNLGQSIIVENKGGAAATMGADAVSRAPADGYTLLAASAHHTIAQAVIPKLRYRIDKDFSSIGTVAMVPNLVVVNAATGIQSIDELVELSTQNPDRFNYASAGPGSAHHLIGEMFQLRTGASLTHIPYSGSAPAVLGLVSDQVQVMFDTVPSALPHIQSKKTLALAATTAKRSSALPDVPTLSEAGLVGFDVGTWMGLTAPAGTPAPVIERLSQALQAAVADPEFQQQMLAHGIEPMPGTPAELDGRIEKEVKEFADLVKQTNLKID